MANSDDSSKVLEGTTIVFGFWACTANGTGGYTSHLIAPEESKTPDDEQLADSPPKLGEKPSIQVSPLSNSASAGNVPTPTHLGESAESDITPDFENFQFSETLGKYVAYLKSIKRAQIVNSELLDGVDRVS